MARGGARVGAGRKPGTPNKRTKALQDAVEASGKTPLDVMIDIMRWANDEAEKLAEACRLALEKSEADEKLKAYFEDGKHLKVLALDAATRAAPYVHARVAAAESPRDGGVADQPVPKAPPRERLEEMRKRYAPARFKAIEGGKHP